MAEWGYTALCTSGFLASNTVPLQQLQFPVPFLSSAPSLSAGILNPPQTPQSYRVYRVSPQSCRVRNTPIGQRGRTCPWTSFTSYKGLGCRQSWNIRVPLTLSVLARQVIPKCWGGTLFCKVTQGEAESLLNLPAPLMVSQRASRRLGICLSLPAQECSFSQGRQWSSQPSKGGIIPLGLKT